MYNLYKAYYIILRHLDPMRNLNDIQSRARCIFYIFTLDL